MKTKRLAPILATLGLLVGTMAVAGVKFHDLAYGEAAAQAAADAVGRLVDMVLDGGAGGGAPSTVINLAADPPRILRAGAVDATAIRAVVPWVHPSGEAG